MGIYYKKTTLFRFWLLVNKEVQKGPLAHSVSSQAAIVRKMRENWKLIKYVLKETRAQRLTMLLVNYYGQVCSFSRTKIQQHSYKIVYM